MNYLTYLDECELVEEKIAYISGWMADLGWVGVPIVVDGEQALTGSHRLTAARIVNQRWEAGDDVRRVDVPTVTLAELYELAGLDYLTTSEAQGQLCVNEHEYYLAMVRALPVSILDEYRIDLH